MKIAYIAHPVSGNIQENLKKIAEIGREINLLELDVVPFAPYYFDFHSLDDDIPEERERGIRNDIELMSRLFIDEVRLYGDRISTGMVHEIKLARKLNIPIRAMTKETKQQLKLF